MGRLPREAHVKKEKVIQEPQKKKGKKKVKVKCKVCYKPKPPKPFKKKKVSRRKTKTISKEEKEFNNKNYTCKDCIRKKNIIKRICDYCGFVAEDKPKLVRHIHSVHVKLKCDACEKTINTVEYLKSHLKRHFLKQQCHQCGLTFGSKMLYESHMHKVHGNPRAKQSKLNTKIGSYTCRHCPKVFDNNAYRLSHEVTNHKKSRDIKFKCLECSKEFVTKDELRTHEFEHFTGIIHHCEFPGCTRYFKRAKLLRVHQYMHRPPSFKCEHCGQTFVQRSGWLKHKRVKSCPFLKVNEFVETSEWKRRAEIAKAQYDLMTAILPKEPIFEELKNEKVKAEKDDLSDEDHFGDTFSDARSDTSMCVDNKLEIDVKPEIKDETFLKEDDAINFLSIHIKEEPVEYLEYEQIEQSYATKVEQSLDSKETVENLQKPILINPFVLLNRLTTKEILRWKKVKDEPKKKKIKSGKPQKIIIIPSIPFYHYTKFTCDWCGESLDGKGRLKLHLVEHKRKKNLTCLLNSCNQRFNRPKDFRKHQQIVHNVQKVLELTYTCDHCGKQFARKDSVRAHVSAVHSSRSSLSCEVCGKILKTKQNMQRHLKTVHGTEELHICQICGKSFGFRNRLVNHIRQKHIERSKCDVCGHMVKNLKEHVKWHYQSRPTLPMVPCTVCGKEINKYRLQLHIAETHEKKYNGRLFACDDCDESYTRREDLRKHKLLKHYQGKIFLCQVPDCGQFFPKGKLLTRHMVSHNPTALKCEVCGKTYKGGRGALLHHIKKAHPEKATKFRNNESLV